MAGMDGRQQRSRRGAVVALVALFGLVMVIAVGGLPADEPQPPTPSGGLAVEPTPDGTPEPTPGAPTPGLPSSGPPTSGVPTPGPSAAEPPPSVPCGSDDLAGAADLVLIVDGVAAVVQSGDLPLVHVPEAGRVEVRTTGDRCATGWNLDTVDPLGTLRVVDRRDRDPGDVDPARQNRWSIPPWTLGIDATILDAAATFVSGETVSRTWRVVVDPFVPPDLQLHASDGTQVTLARGCGLTVDLANGASSSEGCASIEYPAGHVPVLESVAGTALTVSTSGWGVLRWQASCGLMAGADLQRFESPARCSLGGDSVQDGSNPLKVPPLPEPPRFVTPPGTWVIRLDLTATRDGDRFAATWFAQVDGR